MEASHTTTGKLSYKMVSMRSLSNVTTSLHVK